LPQPRQTRRTKQKGQPEPQPKRWRRLATWVVTHFAARYVLAAVVLGVLFLVTATFGTVTNDDIAVAGMLHTPHGQEQVFHYREHTRTQVLPALFQMSKTNVPRLVCAIVPEAEVVDSSSIHISNRFGTTMQSVLNALEWVVGLFYEIHFPTTLQATAKEVRDPNFAHRYLDLQQPGFMETHTALRNPNCERAVSALLQNNALVCPATWFLRSPDRQELLAVGISRHCLSLPTDATPRSIGSDDPGALSRGEDHTPLFTKVKIQLGILHVEVVHKGRQ
jgi:hypothetical protein